MRLTRDNLAMVALSSKHLGLYPESWYLRAVPEKMVSTTKLLKLRAGFMSWCRNPRREKAKLKTAMTSGSSIFCQEGIYRYESSKQQWVLFTVTSGSISMKKEFQYFGPRGRIKEEDASIFSKPIVKTYL